MADIAEADRRHLHAIYNNRLRKSSVTSSNASSLESPDEEAERFRSLKLRKQSSPAYLPSISVTRHESLAPSSATRPPAGSLSRNRASSVRRSSSSALRRPSPLDTTKTNISGSRNLRSTNPR